SGVDHLELYGRARRSGHRQSLRPTFPARVPRRRTAMRRQSIYSRRQFFRVSAAGAAATMVVRPGRARAAVQGPPPFTTAPRAVRKPPLDEPVPIANAYHIDPTADDLT